MPTRARRSRLPPDEARDSPDRRAAPASPDRTAARGVRSLLLGWYARHRRDLPWRRTCDPYAVWVSEVMLQQTRVAAVEPYYRRWMAAFPTVAELAAAEVQDVLALWQGLGYYGRARNLHRSARMIVDRHAGALPTTRQGWLALPGLGPYTAGAVASIAFGEPVAAVDGNARRVLSRLYGVDGDPARRPASERIAGLAAELAHCATPGDVNQALMELGATVCLPKAPRCAGCPLARHCRARLEGRQEELPGKAVRRRPRFERWLAVAVRRAGSDTPWLVARRTSPGLLGGLWEFPMVREGPREARLDEARSLLSELGLEDPSFVPDLQELEPVTHAFTHIRVTATPVLRVHAGHEGGGASPPRPAHAAASGAGWTTCAGASPADGQAVAPPSRPVSRYDRWQLIGDPSAAGLPMSRLMEKILEVVARSAAPAAEHRPGEAQQ